MMVSLLIYIYIYTYTSLGLNELICNQMLDVTGNNVTDLTYVLAVVDYTNMGFCVLVTEMYLYTAFDRYDAMHQAISWTYLKSSPLDKMAAISQTMRSDVFFMNEKMYFD